MMIICTRGLGLNQLDKIEGLLLLTDGTAAGVVANLGGDVELGDCQHVHDGSSSVGFPKIAHEHTPLTYLVHPHLNFLPSTVPHTPSPKDHRPNNEDQSKYQRFTFPASHLSRVPDPPPTTYFKSIDQNCLADRFEDKSGPSPADDNQSNHRLITFPTGHLSREGPKLTMSLLAPPSVIDTTDQAGPQKGAITLTRLLAQSRRTIERPFKNHPSPLSGANHTAAITARGCFLPQKPQTPPPTTFFEIGPPTPLLP
ncbi:hypothetical protein PGT21_021612 [Puccinia graminis f. sp. tritici]|uniref:Uncharacterized protein n=1 Tax=Puccinia graminis f. sp. tritici TaxID=56615 RepID=A0A5B0NLA2_PUCGR|nr:hypothetical protein PGT21_021612 [Puccinia graminis f. sp. tritici]